MSQKVQKAKTKKVKDYDKIAGQLLPNSEPLSNVLNQIIEIENFEEFPSKYGHLIHIITSDGKRYRTTSEVIYKRLQELAEDLANGYVIRVRVVKNKRYYDFSKP